MPVLNFIVGMEGSGAEEYGYTLFGNLLTEGKTIQGFTDNGDGWWWVGDCGDLSAFSDIATNHCKGIGRPPLNQDTSSLLDSLKEAKKGEYIFVFGACFSGLDDARYEEIIRWVRRTEANVLCFEAGYGIEHSSRSREAERYFDNRFYAVLELSEKFTIANMSSEYINLFIEDKNIDFPVFDRFEADSMVSEELTCSHPKTFQELTRDTRKAYHFDIFAHRNN